MTDHRDLVINRGTRDVPGMMPEITDDTVAAVIVNRLGADPEAPADYRNVTAHVWAHGVAKPVLIALLREMADSLEQQADAPAPEPGWLRSIFGGGR